jgi:hypothetical protein
MRNVHILPTDKPSRLFLKENTLLLNNLYTLQRVFPKGKCQDIYITSNEEIKEGDWCLSKLNKAVRFGKSFTTWLYKKIILTTDIDLIKDGIQPIDDDFLEWFVKNPSCEEVEFEKYGYMPEEPCEYKIIIPQEEPKTNLEKLPFPELVEELANYYKEVPLVEEPKQETLEEFIKSQPYYGYCTTEYKEGIEVGAKWQQEQSKNKYSEEEVLVLLHSRMTYTLGEDYKEVTTIEWFEQFKKKQNEKDFN